MSFITTLLVVGLGMVNSVALARLLGPSGRGEVAAIQLWPTMLPYFGATGLLEAFVIFVARDKKNTRILLGNTIVFALAASSLIMPIGYFLMPVFLASQEDWVVHVSRMMLLAVPLALLGDVYSFLLQGLFRIGAFNIQRLVVPIGLPIGLLILHSFQALSVERIIAVQVFLLFLRLIISVSLCLMMKVDLGVGFRWETAREMLLFGLRSHIGAIAQHSNGRLDQALIAAWLPPAKLGLYVAAVSVTSIVSALSNALKVTILPRIATETNKDAQINVLEKYFGIFWTISVLTTPMLAGSLIWGIPFVYGAEFQEAVVPSLILVLGAVLFSAKELLVTAAKAMGAPLIGSKAELLAVVSTVTLLVVLLDPLGIFGAAISALISSSIAFLVVMLGMRSNFGISYRQLFRMDFRSLARVRNLIVKMTKPISSR